MTQSSPESETSREPTLEETQEFAAAFAHFANVQDRVAQANRDLHRSLFEGLAAGAEGMARWTATMSSAGLAAVASQWHALGAAPGAPLLVVSAVSWAVAVAVAGACLNQSLTARLTIVSSAIAESGSADMVRLATEATVLLSKVRSVADETLREQLDSLAASANSRRSTLEDRVLEIRTRSRDVQRAHSLATWSMTLFWCGLVFAAFAMLMG